MRSITILYLFILPAMAFCQSVKVSETKDINWDSYPTFKVAKGEIVAVMKTDIDEEQVLNNIRQTIIDQLSSRGLKLDDENGKLLVDFTGEVVEVTKTQDVGPLGQAPADDATAMDQSHTWSQERREGSLAINISDATSRKTLWQATLTVEFGAADLPIVFDAAAAKCLKKLKVHKK